MPLKRLKPAWAESQQGLGQRHHLSQLCGHRSVTYDPRPAPLRPAALGSVALWVPLTYPPGLETFLTLKSHSLYFQPHASDPLACWLRAAALCSGAACGRPTTLRPEPKSLGSATFYKCWMWGWKTSARPLVLPLSQGTSAKSSHLWSYFSPSISSSFKLLLQQVKIWECLHFPNDVHGSKTNNRCNIFYC